MKKLMIVAFAVASTFAACGGKKTESTTTNTTETPPMDGSGAEGSAMDPATGTETPADGSAEAPAGGM